MVAINNNSFSDLPEILNSDVAADFLGISRETVQTYAREGRLRAAKCGRGYRIRREWLIDFLEGEADREQGGR